MTSLFPHIQLILAQARSCSGKKNIPFYRKLILYLVLVENRFLPVEIIRQILSFGLNNYNIHSADSFLKRLMDKNYIISSPKAYYGRYSLYSLTTTGFKDMSDIYSHFNHECFSFPTDELSKLFKNHRSDSPGPHAVAESISYALLLLHFPPNVIESLEKEVQYESTQGHRLIKEKRLHNLVADLSMLTAQKPQRCVCFEIDLMSERMGGQNGIRKKGIAYAALSSQITSVNPHSQLQVIFSIFDDGWKPDRAGTGNLSSEEMRALSSYLPPHYFALSLIEVALHYKYPNKVLTVSDAIDFLQEHSTDLNNNIFRNKGTQYKTLLSLLNVVARTISPYYDLPLSSIRTTIDIVAKSSNIGTDNALYNHNQNLYRNRRAAVCNMIMKELTDTELNSNLGTALLRGLMFACYPGRYPEQHLPWLLPELFFIRTIHRIVVNLGIVENCSPIDAAYCLPLCGIESKDNYGQIYDNYNIYSRCVFLCEKITVCIENISDDIGGYIRAKNYLQLNSGTRPNTIMILLVNNDKILADGSHIDECTLYNDCQFTYHSSASSNTTIVTYLKYLYNNCPGSQKHNRLLPFIYDHSQDLLMLTYQQFSDAICEVVSPWTLLPDDLGAIKISRGHIPLNMLQTLDPAKPSSMADTLQWNTLF